MRSPGILGAKALGAKALGATIFLNFILDVLVRAGVWGSVYDVKLFLAKFYQTLTPQANRQGY